MTTADNDPRPDSAAEATPASAGRAAGEAGTTSGDHLVPDDALAHFRSHWQVIQQGFVDDPWNAVKEADSLVGDMLEHLAAIFEEQRRHLAGQWSDGEPDTEELRLILRRYRDVLDRLLTI